MNLNFSNETLKVCHKLAADNIKNGETSNVLIGVAKNPIYKLATASCQCTLEFIVKELETQAKYDDSF